MIKYYYCIICEYFDSPIVEMLYTLGSKFEFLPIIMKHNRDYN